MHSRSWIAAACLAAAPLASAQRLPPGVTPVHYDLRFTLDLEHEAFEGTAGIDVNVAQATSRIVLNALELDIKEARVVAGGVSQTAKLETDPERERIALVVERPLAAGPARIETRYSAKLNQNLRGFYLSKSDKRKYAVTQ